MKSRSFELALDLEQRALGVVDEDEPRRPDPRDLAAELGADRAARARDENGLPLEVRRDLLEVDLDLLAAEHVLDLHRADLAGEAEVAGDELVQARKRLDRDFRLLRGLARSGGARSPEADGIAMSNSSGRLSRSTCARSSIPPRTRTPMIRECCLRGSSSMKPIGV